MGHGLLDSRWLLIGVVEFELFFGLWLLAAILPRLTWAAALGLFGLFVCVSLYKALSGYASCGCFGRVEVNPWYTSGLDIAFVLSLSIWRPRGLLRGCSDALAGFPSTLLRAFFCRRATAVLVAWLAIGLPAGYVIESYIDTTLSGAGTIIGDGKVVVLEPEKWIGKRFPLLPFLEDYPDQLQPGNLPVRERLVEGEWIVVLYHHDCPVCQEMMAAYRKLAKKLASGSSVTRMALIEVPPCSGTDPPTALCSDFVVLGKLSNRKEWFVQTPVVVVLHDTNTVSFPFRDEKNAPPSPRRTG